jgi:hypothetical protein
MYGLTLFLARGSTIPSAMPFSALRDIIYVTLVASSSRLCDVPLLHAVALLCILLSFNIFLRLVGFSGYNFDAGLDWFDTGCRWAG